MIGIGLLQLVASASNVANTISSIGDMIMLKALECDYDPEIWEDD